MFAMVLFTAALINIWSASQELVYPTTLGEANDQPNIRSVETIATESSLVYEIVQKDLQQVMELDDEILPSIERIAGTFAQPVWEPLFGGRHRSDQDAVFGMAQNLAYPELTLFVETLATVNYTGDIVLCVDFDAWKSNQSQATLVWLTRYIPEKYPRMNLVLYPSLYEPNEELGTKPDKHRMMGSAKLFVNQSGGAGPQAGDEGTRKRGEHSPERFDPRPIRSFVQLRFEFFNVWVRHYSTQSRIGIFDIHDVHFQRNPFQNISKEDTSVSWPVPLGPNGA